MASSEWPGSIAANRAPGSAGALIPAIARAHRAMAEKLLQGTGLRTGQELVIMLLGDSPGQSQSAITRWLGVEPPTTAKMLARLERAGFVQRVRSADDRRVVLVSLTDKGQSLHHRVGEMWNELNAIPTAGFNQTDQLELDRLLLRVLGNLSPETPDETLIVDLDC
ncbi:MAG TPA: MarR family winged helix-turn-helix transcriptional regulator [Galbitalea sp.]|jgi:DNA-binding MarR family transcriptional regulator|nr:MarR family winged helix-turn-helix transcriptional regulator [Galbitalea sp.]